MDLVSDCFLKQKAKKSLKLNDTIMSELMDVQKMLEIKSKQIAQKEKELKEREKNIENTKQRALQTLREEFALQMKEHEVKLNKECQAILKKAMQAERNLQNKIKLASSKSTSSLSQSEILK